MTKCPPYAHTHTHRNWVLLTFLLRCFFLDFFARGPGVLVTNNIDPELPGGFLWRILKIILQMFM